MLLQLFTTLAAAQAGNAGPVAAAQTPATAPPNTAAPCMGAEYHRLDFWVGRWDVYAKDKLVAHSLIEAVYGCGIRENWMPLNKPGGGSLSIYVPDEKRWEQFWIDSSGSRAIFTGAWTGSAMVISGKWGGPIVRMTYSKNADGSVRQFGEQSTDEGRTWKPAFDFTYRAVAAATR
ncbi:MAG: hypothetical protein ACJ8FO_01500 [Sphingomicrobium sp.]